MADGGGYARKQGPHTGSYGEPAAWAHGDCSLAYEGRGHIAASDLALVRVLPTTGADLTRGR